MCEEHRPNADAVARVAPRPLGDTAVEPVALEPVDRVQLTTVVDNLERVGLVRRQRDAKDRRVIYVHLTDAGSSKIEAVLPGHVAALVEELKVLSPGEQEMLSKLCKKLGRGRRSE